MGGGRFLRFGVSVLFVVSLSLFLAAPALAIEYGGFGGRPAFPRSDNPRTESIFIHTLEPGVVQDEGVAVVNNSQEEKTVLVYGVDSTPSTGGAFACEQKSQSKDDVGAWITLEKTELTLAPATNEIIPFTIAVPETASVGEHNGCIVIQEKKEEKHDDDASGISLSFRTGLRVAVTVPGELERELSIAGFNVIPRDREGFFLKPLVENVGNVSVDADVQVVTKYFFGSTLAEHGGQYPILRGDTSDWNFELKQPFWGGLYRSSFAVEYDQNAEAGVGTQSGKELTKIESDPIWFWSFPTVPGLAIEVLLLLTILSGFLLLLLSRKRKRWIKKHWVMYEVKQGDIVNAIAEDFSVSWKLLVRVNRLKAPYALKPGEKIKVPPKDEDQ